ncbi:hypothetical protein TsFJ059_008678 [Trichoderma semiorbis]|uniref:BZIP domain-containing protein n=1 Tax=Trichoderma semiorbis TaxID=1491008 RepID=A0A9P8HJP5_9HYPO|nr:hypothetical protein TsFJ059_008678 [Trichoderma semiorbis]
MATFQRFRLVPLRDEKLDEKDDWSGLKDAKERRKRQNRLNQRVARRRQRLNLAQEHESETTTAVLPAASASERGKPVVPSHQVYFPLTPDHRLLYVIVLNVSRAVITNFFILSSISPIASTMCDVRRTFSLSDLKCAPQNLDGTPAIPPAFTPTRLQAEIPHPGWIDLFPSPQLRDNLILAVEEFNINEDEILQDLIGDIFASIGCTPDDFRPSPDDSKSTPDKESSPVVELDDEIEVSTPPPTTVGMTPLQEYRLRTFTPASSSSTELGILSWSDPWDISGWEFTEKFFTKWGYLLQGCPDVLNAANKWRTLRGEDPLVPVEI